MNTLLVLLLIWGIVTVVGHGSWVLLRGLLTGHWSSDQTDRPGGAGTPNWQGDHEAMRRMLDWAVSKGRMSRGDADAQLRRLEREEVDLTSRGASAPGVAIATKRLVDVQPPTRRPTIDLAVKDSGGDAGSVVASDVPGGPQPRRLTAGGLNGGGLAERPPVVAAKPWTEALSGFLDRHNIRWGELVAGILVVSCSVGLVVSLWNTITGTHRVVPAVIFVSANAAVFAAGLYTMRRWRLRHTSRAILIIATALVPLAVLAALAAAGGNAGAAGLIGDPVSMAVVAGLAVVVAGLVRAAAVDLIGRAASWPMTAGVLAPTIGLVGVSMAALRSSAMVVWAVGPAVLVAAAALVWVGRTRSRRADKCPVPGPQVASNRWWLHGLVAFCVAVLVGYAVTNVERDVWTSLAIVTVPLAIAIGVIHWPSTNSKTTGRVPIVDWVIAVLATGSVAAISPASIERLDWLLGHAAVTSAAWIVVSTATRRFRLVAWGVAPVAIAGWLTSPVWIGGASWADVSLWRCIIGGEPMLVAMGLAATAAGLGRCFTGEIRRVGLQMAVAAAGAATVAAVALSVAEASWRGIVPASIVAAWLAIVCAALVLVHRRVIESIDDGRRLWAIGVTGTAVAASVAVWGPVRWVDGSPDLVQSLAAAVSLTAGLVMTAAVGLNEAWGRWRGGVGMLASAWRSVAWPATGLMVAGVVIESVWAGLRPGWIAGGLAIGQIAWVVSWGAVVLAAVAIGWLGWQSGSRWLMGISAAGTVLAGVRGWTLFDGGIAWVNPWVQTDAIWVVAAAAVIAAIAWQWLRLGMVELRGTATDLTGVAAAIFGVAAIRTLAPGLMQVVGVVGDWGGLPVSGSGQLAAVVACFGAVGLLVAPEVVDFAKNPGGEDGFLAKSTTGWVGLAAAWCGVWAVLQRYELAADIRLMIAAGVVAASLGAVAWLDRAGRAAWQNAIVGGSAVAGALLWVGGWWQPTMAAQSVAIWPTAAVAVSVALAAWWVTDRRVGAVFATVAASMLPSLIAAIVGGRWPAGLAIAGDVPLNWAVAVQAGVLGWGLAARWTAGSVGGDIPSPPDPLSPKRGEGEPDSMEVPALGWGDVGWWPMAATAVLTSVVIAVGIVDPPVGISAMGIATILDQPVGWLLVLVVALGSMLNWGRRAIDIGGDVGTEPWRVQLPLRVTLAAPAIASMTAATGVFDWLATWGLAVPAGATLVGMLGLVVLAAAASTWRLVVQTASDQRWALTHVMAVSIAIPIIVVFTDDGWETGGWLVALVVAANVAAGIGWAFSTTSMASPGGAGRRGMELAAGWWILTGGLAIAWEVPGRWWGSPAAPVPLLGWLVGWVVLWRLAPVKSGLRWPLGSLETLIVGWTATVAWVAPLMMDTPPQTALHWTRALGWSWPVLSVAPLAVFVLWIIRPKSAPTAASLAGLPVGVAILAASWSTMAAAVPETALAISLIAAAVSLVIWGRFVPAVEARGDNNVLLRTADVLLGWATVTSALVAWLIVSHIGDVDVAGPARLAAASLLLLAYGLSSLAEQTAFVSQNAVCVSLQRKTLLAFLLAVGLLSIGGLPADYPGLTAVMRLGIASVLTGGFVVAASTRLAPRDWRVRWASGLRWGSLAAAATAGVCLVAVLATEASLRVTGGELTDLSRPLVLAVAVAIGASAVILGIVAVLSGPSPRNTSEAQDQGILRLSDTDRRRVIIGAQLLGSVTWLHLQLCRIEIGWSLRVYWPLIVMGLAATSVGLVQWARRRGDTLLADLMNRTAMFLPLIPVVGFWLTSLTTDSGDSWQIVGSRIPYGLVLWIGAGFYVVGSMLDRSALPRVAAVILGNAAIWVTLTQTPGWGFLAHPQAWLIPPALCVLAGVHRYRDRLGQPTAEAIRYAATLAIYLASTADLMLAGAGEWLGGPIILIALSLVGMLAGVLLQIRAFLYLGTCFVGLGTLSMVWHAGRAIDAVWPWWVFGITTGVLLLVGLTMIERHRPALTRRLEQLARWQ